MVRLLMSVGSWLVWRLAEKATRPEPERTDIPRALPAGSEDGVESHTTRHLPSRMMGSVSFCPLVSIGPHNRSTVNSTGRSKVTNLGCMTGRFKCLSGISAFVPYRVVTFDLTWGAGPNDNNLKEPRPKNQDKMLRIKDGNIFRRTLRTV